MSQSDNKNSIEYIEKLERAIRDRWGEDAVANPKGQIDEEFLEEHNIQKEKFIRRIFDKANEKKYERLEDGDYKIDKAFQDKSNYKSCETCHKSHMHLSDSLYLKYYGVCKSCYINYIEGREERWESGWRPEKNDVSEVENE